MSLTSAIASSSTTFTQPLARPSLRTDLRLPQVSAWHPPRRRVLVQVASIGSDPEGERELPFPHHITRKSHDNEIAEDSDYEEKATRQLQAEKEARWQAREARVVPDTHRDLLEFLLTTEEQEMEFEVARCRPRLTEAFFAFLESELGSVRFAVNKTAVEDMVAELEVLEKVLRRGIEAYDEVAADLWDANERLMRIFCSRNKNKTLLEMAGNNEIDKPLLALLDESIATATKANEEQAAMFMEEIRGTVVKYLTL